MKITLILIIAALIQAHTVTYGQDITLSRQDISLSELFKEIKKQTGCDFLYNPQMIAKAKHISINAAKTPLETVLKNCFADQPLTYTVDQNTIIIKEKFPLGQSNGGTSVITGRVINQEDKKPVENASVFLSNATIGGKTDADGKFGLRNVKPGNYQLVVSVVGFEPYHQAINLNDKDVSLSDIDIVPKTIKLNEVIIRSRNDRYHDWNYELFKEGFLGTTDLAADCKILNPQVLDFDYDDKTGMLSASSSDFLMVENNALGYRIKYLLSNFTIDKTGQSVEYDGSVLFENMKGTSSQESRWLRKREAVYSTSEMRFLRALHDNQLDEGSFRVLRYATYPNPQRPPDSLIAKKVEFYKKAAPRTGKRKDSLAYWIKKSELPKVFRKLQHIPLKREEVMFKTDQEGLYALACDSDDLFVEYNKNHRFHENDRLAQLNDRLNREETVLGFISPYTFFDDNGWVSNPKSISLLGAWGKYRVAGMLPADYEPMQQIKTDNRIVAADTSNATKQLLALKNESDTLISKYRAEKMYIQFDKPYYAAGDTIWFKAWLINAPTYLLSDQSKFLHVDIANDSNKVIKQYLLPVEAGVSWGNIALDEKDYKPGNYVIRAYTQWMRNFGEDYYYYKNIKVTGANEGGWLVNTKINTSDAVDKQNVTAKLQFTGMDKAPVANKGLQLQVMNGKRNLYKQTLKTDPDGLLDVNFTLPPKHDAITVVAQNETKDKKVIIPVVINRPENTDLQFLPEGGDLVAGFTTHIGFKAIGEDGKGVNVSGIITDQNQKQATTFQTQHNGIGSFDLFGEKDAQYTAKVTLPNGIVKNYPLPPIKASGTVLQVKDIAEKDSLELRFGTTDDIVQAMGSYFLIGKARGVICYAAVVNLRKSGIIRNKIAKSFFPSGITHFIVMTPQAKPLNERLVYIDHHDDLHISIEPDRADYAAKDSVALHIKVTDTTGNPITGNFSLAVTDDAQVKADSLNDDNILTRLLLTSDLKGYVEEPGYYFRQNMASKQALDNLLLTQGWVSYEPVDVKMPYAAETEYVVKGRVNNVFGGAVKKAHVMLFSKTPTILMDTTTDKDGRFTFTRFSRVDTPVFFLKTVDRSFNVNIDIDEIAPPVFNAPKMPLVMPWYINADSTLMNYVKSNNQMKQLEYIPGTGRHLKEVKITAKKTVKGSYNLNGSGNADVVIDEKQLENSGKKNWRKLFEENIRGFREVDSFVLVDNILVLHKNFYAYTKPVVLLLDGVIISKLYNVWWDFRQFIEFHNAEDIKGIEVITSAKYTANYMRIFFPMAPLDSCVFVEVTTRSGSPMISNTPGTYLYKPLAISWPKQFYKPRYPVSDTSHTIDLRSTIHWEPNIITDVEGKATVSFYAGSVPSTYGVIMQGVDENGMLGYKQKNIVIVKQKESAKSK